MATMLDDFTVCQIMGVSVAYDPGQTASWIVDALECGTYELPEATALMGLLQGSDRVLDIGAGLGFTAVLASKIAEHVLAYEPNPRILPALKATKALNGASNLEIVDAAVSVQTKDLDTFYLREAFWASSLERDTKPYLEAIQCRSVSLSSIIQHFKPTVVACDCEGLEFKLFDSVDLLEVHTIIVEVHEFERRDPLLINGFSPSGKIADGRRSKVESFTRNKADRLPIRRV
ncbi:FkbM family methyltransferase [Rhizobium leguminosarum]|uniref:FkbM family methyltransferase n=1 Tax=Rhizobium leguminosarum TaxID=384 RepID=UPI001C95B951|nr:FkbM family methyltransferase [Rhizobium leguminosarum]MBY5572204.1 FkbM family methyltransferase [Rhizobium leguminosarum]MBY5578809.1 FkbM family methyltransferase [Rhizobium leguminosarum]